MGIRGIHLELTQRLAVGAGSVRRPSGGLARCIPERHPAGNALLPGHHGHGGGEVDAVPGLALQEFGEDVHAVAVISALNRRIEGIRERRAAKVALDCHGFGIWRRRRAYRIPGCVRDSFGHVLRQGGEDRIHVAGIRRGQAAQPLRGQVGGNAQDLVVLSGGAAGTVVEHGHGLRVPGPGAVGPGNTQRIIRGQQPWTGIAVAADPGDHRGSRGAFGGGVAGSSLCHRGHSVAPLVRPEVRRPAPAGKILQSGRAKVDGFCGGGGIGDPAGGLRLAQVIAQGHDGIQPAGAGPEVEPGSLREGAGGEAGQHNGEQHRQRERRRRNGGAPAQPEAGHRNPGALLFTAGSGGQQQEEPGGGQ